MKAHNYQIRKFSWTDYNELTVTTDWLLPWKYTLTSASFQLSDKTVMTNEANHWDQYKWLKTKISWRPAYGGMDLTQMNVNSAATPISAMPYWAAKVDHDDTTLTLQTLDDIMKDGGRHGIFNKPRSVTFRPTALNMLYKGISTTGYAVPRVTPWVDCVDNSVPHYGLKWGIGMKVDLSTKSGWVPYYMTVTHWVAFRNRLQGTNLGGNF